MLFVPLLTKTGNTVGRMGNSVLVVSPGPPGTAGRVVSTGPPVVNTGPVGVVVVVTCPLTKKY